MDAPPAKFKLTVGNIPETLKKRTKHAQMSTKTIDELCERTWHANQIMMLRQ